jgi:two-component system sensor histidine kinase/response regulator
MGNAVKFTEKGEIELSLEIEKEQDEHVLIHLKVRDTGIGIPEDKLESIFDVFQQADDSLTKKYGGTGLGLSICRKIAHLMNGEVWAESGEGKGSTFHFTALLKKSDKKHLKRFLPISLSGKKVLVTDDNKSNLEILTHIIESAGMHVIRCTNADEAYEAVREATANSSLDICILDIVMPGMSGYELAKKIRLRCGESMPLLAFSSATEGAAKKCREAGFNGFLPKPVTRVKLLKMIERLLSDVSDKVHCEERDTKIITQHSMRDDAKHAISILLAEDNPVNQKMTTKLLTKAGYSVDVAVNGKEVVDMFTADPEKYDIILMDLQMPILNGLDATKQIRNWELPEGTGDPGTARRRGKNTGIQEEEDPLRNAKCEMRDEEKTREKSRTATGNRQQAARIPIVAVTANAMMGDREKCLAVGMDDYIPKPIKRDVMFEVLKKWVIDPA